MTLSVLETSLPRLRSHDTLALDISAQNWCLGVNWLTVQGDLLAVVTQSIVTQSKVISCVQYFTSKTVRFTRSMWNVRKSIRKVLFFIKSSMMPGGNFWIAASDGTKTVKYLPTKIWNYLSHKPSRSRPMSVKKNLESCQSNTDAVTVSSLDCDHNNWWDLYSHLSGYFWLIALKVR